VTTSINSTPKLYTSAFAVAPTPSHVSGATYLFDIPQILCPMNLYEDKI
jgi:hypothetical protein